MLKPAEGVSEIRECSEKDIGLSRVSNGSREEGGEGGEGVGGKEVGGGKLVIIVMCVG